MIINIDENAGFCFGVVKAIAAAENELENSSSLNCLGDIVHNNEEVSRLSAKGLYVIDHQKFQSLNNTKVLIRAHGEPPETYKIAQERNIELIDATCPIVLALQKKISEGYKDMKSREGQIVIFGKNGHAEVIGLNGQAENSAIIVSHTQDIERINFSKPIRLYSQTTKSKEDYNELINIIAKKCEQCGNQDFIAFNTICNRVANRAQQLRQFAQNLDIIIFVSGSNSSNGHYLFEHCKNVNSRTYFVSEISQINIDWFNGAENIGITGATSTPRWLMEEISDYIKQIHGIK